MMAQKSSTISIIVVAAVVVLGAGVAVFALGGPNDSSDNTKPTSEPAPSVKQNSNGTGEAAVGSTVIRFTDDGFDKHEYTSKAGESVTVKNESSTDLEFSSDDHPTHREHPELNMQTLAPGKSGTVTPTTAGTYMFHDHIRDEFTGKLTVE